MRNLKSCEGHSAWTVLKIEITSTIQDLLLVLTVVIELNALLMQNIHIIKSTFRLQILASFSLFFDQLGSDYLLLKIDRTICSLQNMYIAPRVIVVIIRFC